MFFWPALFESWGRHSFALEWVGITLDLIVAVYRKRVPT